MILRAVILQTILFPGSDQCERLLICPTFVFLRNAMQRKMQARLGSLPRTQASFIEPMECLSVSRLPEGAPCIWEIKLDGYRALAVKSPTGVTLFSRNRKSLNRQFPYIVEALADLPEGTVVDGEVVAIDDSDRPNFNLLQNFRAEASRIQYYVFDLLCWKDRDLTRLPLIERRMLLNALLVVNDKRIRIADYVEAAPRDLLAAVREQGLEGIVGKQKDSHYQPGKRSGAWIKYRVNRGQEFVIGGYAILTRSTLACMGICSISACVGMSRCGCAALLRDVPAISGCSTTDQISRPWSKSKRPIT